MTDTRVFMYRAGEARLFASPADVPEGEGWVDSPVKVVEPEVADEPAAEGELPKKRGRPPKPKPEDETPGGAAAPS